MKHLIGLPPNFLYHAVVGFSICKETIINHAPLQRDTDGRLLVTKIPAIVDNCVGGTSYDVALALKKTFDFNVKLVASVGKDPHGPDRSYILNHVPEQDLEFEALDVRDGTSVGTIIIEDGKPPYILSYKTRYVEYPIDTVKRHVELSKPAITLATGVMAEEANMVHALFTANRQAPSILNPRIDLITSRREFHEILQETSILILNHEELAAYYSQTIMENEVTQESLKPLHDAGVRWIIVTCNEHGAILSCPSHNLWIHQPRIQFGEPEDKTGAGDSFLSAVVAALLNDKPPTEVMRWGAVMAGLKVRRRGGANIPTKEEFSQALENKI